MAEPALDGLGATYLGWPDGFHR